MKYHRNAPRRGKSLPAMEIGTLLAADPELCGRHAALCAAGFKVCPTVRLRRSADGWYSVRVVWRRRRDGCSVVTETVRYQDLEMVEVL